MKPEEKIKLELERQNFLYTYWNNAEKIKWGIFSFISATVILPTILNADFKLNNWVNWALIIEIIALIFIVIKRTDEYSEKQKKIREIIEKLKI